MRAGQLRHRITIEEVTETQSSTGEVQESWSTFAERWAEMIGISGDERFAGEQFHGEVDHAFRIRHLDGVTTKMRINYDSRIFDIKARFDPTGKAEELMMLTEEDA